jgi:hypothetical protein
MKQAPIVAAFCISLTATLFAADPPPAVSLRAKRLSSIKDVKSEWRTDYGSYAKDFSRAIAVEVSLSNLRAEPVDLTVEYLFIGKTLKGSHRFIFDRKVIDVTLDKKQHYTGMELSARLDASVQNYEALGEKYAEGGKIEGYIVRVLHGEKVVKVEASSQPLKNIGQSQLEVEALPKN